MMTKSVLFARTTMALALVCASGGAYAQSADTSDPAESPEVDADPQEVVVTAQRREQTLIEVPQSISVIGGETLERQQARLFDVDGVVTAGRFPFAVPPALGGTAIRLINVSTIRPRTLGLIVGAEF